MDNEVATDAGRENKCFLWITGLFKITSGANGDWVKKETGVENDNNVYFQLDKSLGEAKTDVRYRAFIRCKPGGSLADQMTDLAFRLITITIRTHIDFTRCTRHASISTNSHLYEHLYPSKY